MNQGGELEYLLWTQPQAAVWGPISSELSRFLFSLATACALPRGPVGVSPAGGGPNPHPQPAVALAASARRFLDPRLSVASQHQGRESPAPCRGWPLPPAPQPPRAASALCGSPGRRDARPKFYGAERQGTFLRVGSAPEAPGAPWGACIPGPSSPPRAASSQSLRAAVDGAPKPGYPWF